MEWTKPEAAKVPETVKMVRPPGMRVASRFCTRARRRAGRRARARGRRPELASAAPAPETDRRAVGRGPARSQVELELPMDPFAAEGHAEKQIHQDFFQGFDTSDLSDTILE